MERPETTKMKKSWCEPALIVLVRGKPEEAILGACKTSVVGGTDARGSSWFYDGCSTSTGTCAVCSLRAAS